MTVERSWEDRLSESWDNIPKVQLLPVGNWRLKLINASLKQAKSEESNASVLFIYSPQEPMDNVDRDALHELGPDYDVTGNRVFHRIWLETDADIDAVRNHLVLHGVDVNVVSPLESLKAAKGTEVNAFLVQRSFPSGLETRMENAATSFQAL